MSEIKRLLEKITCETKLSIGIEQANRGKKPWWAVLMGQVYSPPRPGLHLDRLRERLTLKEALEFLRGFCVGYCLGSGKLRPGPKTVKFIQEEVMSNDEAGSRPAEAVDSGRSPQVGSGL